MTLFEPEVLLCEDCLRSILDNDSQFFYEAACIYYASTERYFELADEYGYQVRLLEKLGAVMSTECTSDCILVKPLGYEKISGEIHKFCFNNH